MRLLLSVLAVIAVALLVTLPQLEPRKVLQQEPEPAPLGEGYAGVDVCKRCHARETEAWERSPHGLHATPRAEPAGGADGAIGSSWMQAYIKRDLRGYHRIQARCYDLREERWRSVVTVLQAIRGPRPGEPAITTTALADRSFEIDCAGCHASGPRLRIDPATQQMRSSWRDLAIDCEACHGPGAAHAQAWSRLDDGASLAPLNRLPARTATAVCGRCHGGPPAVGDYDPADAVHFVGLLEEGPHVRPDGTPVGQMYQYAAFLRSPCHLEGGLACTDCHAVHGPGLKPQPHADAMCVRCHETYASHAHTHHAMDGPGARCTACHMPPLFEGLLGHQRDHRIGVPLPASPYVANACTKCHADKPPRWADRAWRRWWGTPPAQTLDAIQGVRLGRDGDPQARDLLRAAKAHADPWFRVAAAYHLRDPESIADDALPEVRMAAVRVAEHVRDVEVLKRLMRDGHAAIRAAAGMALWKLGHEDVTSTDDRRILARQERERTTVRVRLARELVAAGAWEEALAHLEAALAYRPDAPDAWRRLAEVYEALGRQAEARAARARAHALRTLGGGR